MSAAAVSAGGGWFEQPAWQVTVPVHGPAHHHHFIDHFVKEDVLFERTEHDKESPVVQTRVVEAAARIQQRVLSRRRICFSRLDSLRLRGVGSSVDVSHS